MKEIPVSQIVDNPFQARKEFDRESIRSLAEEIKAEGFWNTTLQGRKKGDKVELVFGHRRLRALKMLGVKDVRIEIVPLTDAQMALRSLEENFQREGLTDLEKADAVKVAVEIVGNDDPKHAVKRVASSLGLQETWVYELCQIGSAMAESDRKVIKAGYLTAKTAARAKEWGGAGLVKTLAEQGKRSVQGDGAKPTHMTVAAFKKNVAAIPDETIRERVKNLVVEGKIKDPADVPARARMLASTKAHRSKQPPPDLREVIVNWTHQFREWLAKLKEVRPYMEYVEGVPSVAANFRKAAADLAAALEDVSHG